MKFAGGLSACMREGRRERKRSEVFTVSPVIFSCIEEVDSED